MKIIKNLTLAALIGLLKTSLVCQAQMTYDAATEFSPTNNPTAVWSYGYSGSFSAFTAFPSHSDQPSTLPFWRPDPNSPVPTVGKNTSGQILEASGNIFQIDQMVFHPGDSMCDQYAIVRFMAPKTGAYTLTARFSGLYTLDAGTTSDVHVLVNGMSFFDGTVQGYGSEVSFTPPSSLTLRDGDTVDFVVGNGGNGYWGDFTGLAATVTFIRPATRADDEGRDHRDAIITWTKHITAFLPPGGEIFATIAGTAEGGIGDGTLVGEAFNPRVMLTPTSVTFEADYHFIGSKHSLTVHFRTVQGPDQNGVTRGVITGFVKNGWLKGNVVVGEYQGYPCAEGTGVCFDGTFVIKKGSKNKD